MRKGRPGEEEREKEEERGKRGRIRGENSQICPFSVMLV